MTRKSLAAYDFNGQKLSNIGDGTVETDGVSLGQLNARKLKTSVFLATTAALPSVTYDSGAGTLTATANGALGSIDGWPLLVGQDLLVKDQASSFQNGIYTVTQVGSGGAPFILTRRADANTAAKLTYPLVQVTLGTVHDGDSFTQYQTLSNLTSDTQNWVKVTEDYQTFVFTKQGSLSVASGVSRLYLDESYVIYQVRASVNTAPTGASIIVDVNKNGTTIFTTQSRRPTIAASGFTATNGTPIEVTALAAGDYLTIDIDQVGSTIPGSDLTVNVRLRRL